MYTDILKIHFLYCLMSQDIKIYYLIQVAYLTIVLCVSYIINEFRL